MKQIFNIILLFFIIFIDVLLSAKISSKEPVKSPEDALLWLNKYGYNPCSNSDAQCSLSFSSLLKEYQQRFRLKITGKLDETTKQHMNRPRCGIPDKPIAELSAISSRLKWSRSPLTYSIRSYPTQTQISQTNTKNIIRDAFKAWIDYIPLEIKETCSTCSSDFVIDFAYEQHSDDYPFDGIGGTLAHAFFPEDGRVHFDKDEAWTERFDDDKTNLFLVAVHEIGHALGLDHSYDTRSIMYPSYQSMQKKDILPQFDRASIQSVYGKKQSSSSTSTTTRYTPTSKTTRFTETSTRRSVTSSRSPVTVPGGRSHPRCRLFIDAAFDHPDGTFHTFKAGIIWRYLSDEHRWDDRVQLFTQIYPDIPDQLAAGVYNSRRKEITFFTHEKVYRYAVDNQNHAKYQSEELLPRNLRNSILGAIYYRDEIYVITSKTIRLFQFGIIYQQSKDRALSEEFPSFTGTITKAFSHGNLHHFFTSNGLVYVWNERSRSWPIFAQPMETSWFACLSTETYITNDS